MENLNISLQEQQHISKQETFQYPIPLGVFVFMSALTLGALMKEATKKIPIPYPAAIFILGIALGANINSIDFYLIKDALNIIRDLDGSNMMSIFIPPMVFYSAYTADIYILKHHLLQIIMLSFPSLIVSAILIAIALKWLFLYDDDYYNWGFGFLFGTIVSCTDPMEVITILTNAAAPKKFISMVQGESLFNNCTSMVFLLISIQISRGQYDDIANIVKYGFSILIFGILMGVFVGILTIYWMKMMNNSNTLTINVMIVSTYLTYFISENLYQFFYSNGLVSVITLGVFMSAFTRTKVRSESEYSIEVFWQYMTFIVQTQIFLYTGLTVGIRLLANDSQFIRTIDYHNLPLLYLCVLGSRFISILLLMNTISHWGYGMKLSEMILFTYSGCRGALQLSFALLVVQELSFSEQFSDIILFHCSGIVIFTMLINGSTMGLMVRLLRLSRAQAGKQKVFTIFLQEMCDQVEQKLSHMKVDLQDKKVDWDRVHYFAGLEEIGKNINKNLQDIEKRYKSEEKQKVKQQQNSIEMKFQNHLKTSTDILNQSIEQGWNEVDELSQELVQEARDRFLMALRQTYWDLFSQNQCSGKALSLLVESQRWDLDTVHSRMCSWDFIYNLFYSPIYIRFLYWLKGFPVISRFAGDMLFDWIGMSYDVISTYVKAHEEMESVIQDFPIQHQVMQVITRESQENRTNAERYITGYLNVSFPEIIILIQNKKAGLRLLQSQKRFCEIKNSNGELENQEYRNLQDELNNLIGRVEDLHPSWRAVQTYKKLQGLDLFKEFNEQLLQQLCKNCLELIYVKDQCITREGELARYVYVILRGKVVETCQNSNSNYTQIRNIGNIISPHHIMLQSSIYITQNVAEAMVEVLAIEIEVMIKLVQKSSYMQQFLWTESLYALSRFYFNQMKPLGQLDDVILKQMTKFMRFQKFKRGSIIKFQGAILLAGKVQNKIYSFTSPQSSIRPMEESNEQEDPSATFIKPEIINGPHLFAHSHNENYTFLALTQVHGFLFDTAHVDEISQTMVQGLSLDKNNLNKECTENKQQRKYVNRQSFGYNYLRRPNSNNSSLPVHEEVKPIVKFSLFQSQAQESD